MYSYIYMYLLYDENHTIVPINIKNQNRNMLRHKKDNKKIILVGIKSGGIPQGRVNGRTVETNRFRVPT